MLSPPKRYEGNQGPPRFDPSTTPTRSNQSTTQSKRLSRISPSEFDTLLSSSSTKHTTLLDETSLGDLSPQSSPERDLSVPSIPTPITPQRDNDNGDESFKRRSMFRSVGNASSPDLASLVRKAREQRALLDNAQLETDSRSQLEGDQGEEEEDEDYRFESPTKPSRTASPRSSSPTPTSPPSHSLLGGGGGSTSSTQRSRSTTSPEISLSEFAAQTSSSTTSSSSPRIFNPPPPASSSTPRTRESTNLSHDSTTSSSAASSGFVLIPPQSPTITNDNDPIPPASPPRTLTSTVQALKNQRQGLGTGLEKERIGNHSTTSLISSFGLDFSSSSGGGGGTSNGSPRRKRGTTNDTGGGGGREEESGKLSLGNTMRKTSRFFKKFGTSSTSNPTSASNTIGSMAASSGSRNTQQPSSSAPSVPLPPPVPPIPSTYTSPIRSLAPIVSSSSPSRTTPTRPSTSSSTTSSRGTTPLELSSNGMIRDRSKDSVGSNESSSSKKVIRRRRSLSTPQPVSLSPQGITSSSSKTRSPEKLTGSGAGGGGGGGGEGDRLRNELRMWRLGVDGVLGGSFGNNDGHGESSSSIVGVGANRRPSLPEGKITALGGGGIKMGRNGSLPLAMEVQGQERQTMPSIKLSSPGGKLSNRGSPKRLPLNLSSAGGGGGGGDGFGVGGGGAGYDYDTLGSIPETSHSRENSNATITSQGQSPRIGSPSSPQLGSTGGGGLLPMSPPMVSIPSSGSGKSNRSNPNSRVSIVGYPSSSTTTMNRHLTSPPLPSPPPSSSTNMLMGSSKTSSTSSLPLSISTTTNSSPQLSVTSTLRNQPATPSSAPSPITASVAAGEGEEGRENEVLEERGKEFAKKCWEEDEGFLERKKIAEWLGSSHELNRVSLRHYIDRFDFSGLRLDLAFRRLCGKLYLKAETQQVDRILEQFSRKYYQDNPRSPYSSADVVHAVSYSMLLLNTDLHVVDTTTRMTRQQFIRNTLSAIHAQTGLVDENLTPFSPTLSDFEGGGGGSELGMTISEGNVSRKSLERPRTGGGGAKRPSTAGAGANSPASSTRFGVGGSPNQSRVSLGAGSGGADSPLRGGGTGLGLSQRSESVMTVASVGSNKSVEANLQVVLKDMYNAIRSQPIYQSSSSSTLNLPSSADPSRPSLALSPTNSPYSTWSTGINRTASRRSGTSSAASSQVYGGSSSKRSSVRGFGALLGANSSLDLVRSTSPTPSTSTSLSDEQWSTAFGVAASSHHNVPTIGFANSLSHTIIREQQEDDTRSIASSSISVTDEELALLGAPWAKEGILQRKHYWEVQGKRSKEKNWLKAFVVVSQGELRMFRFDGGGGSSGRKGAGMGGGDWTSNASNVGSISLIHALCSAMPPPGYSRDRPHCFVLTLPSGGSYFFQAGTPDLVSEWVQTCNYWSARLSREPLSGGVSNVEYGWNKVESKFDRPDDGPSNDRDEVASVKSGKSGHSRMSYAGSAFQSSSGLGGAGVNDRMRIEDWKPPNVPLSRSTLAEEAQLDHLKKHVKIVQAELEHHNELRAPMVRLYSSRSSNYAKALANWETKSQHLLTEIVKWSTYIEALTSAVRLRSIQRGKKEVEAMLKSADLDEDEEAEEDDDELASRLSPFDEMPSPQHSQGSNATSRPPPPTEGVKRLQQLDDRPKSARSSSDHEERRVNYPSISRTSVTTTSTRGDEFFDSNDTTPPAVL